jgi:hypothetical protein
LKINYLGEMISRIQAVDPGSDLGIEKRVSRAEAFGVEVAGDQVNGKRKAIQ